METLYALAVAGLYIKKIHDALLVLAAIVMLMAVLFGPVFCGRVCPQGTVQEWNVDRAY